MLDIIIYGGYVVTMEGPGTGLINNGAVGIKGNKIEVVGSTDEVMRQYKAHRYIEAIAWEICGIIILNFRALLTYICIHQMQLCGAYPRICPPQNGCSEVFCPC